MGTHSKSSGTACSIESSSWSKAIAGKLFQGAGCGSDWCGWEQHTRTSGQQQNSRRFFKALTGRVAVPQLEFAGSRCPKARDARAIEAPLELANSVQHTHASCVHVCAT